MEICEVENAIKCVELNKTCGKDGVYMRNILNILISALCFYSCFTSSSWLSVVLFSRIKD